MTGKPPLTVLEGGVSNSRPLPDSWNGAGVDTVRFRFRGDAHGHARFARSGANNEGPRGELYRQEDGVRVGAYRDGTLYVEGRLAAVLRGRDDHALLPVAALREGAEMASRRFGFPVDVSIASVGRLDVAAELRFANGADGLAFLHALSLADVPWAKVGTEGKKRERIQTVNFRSVRGRTILMRAYDKGIEAGVASPGERIRLERQRRYRKRDELAVTAATELDVPRLFIGRELEALARVTAEVVCDQWGAIDRLNELVSWGWITAPRADALAGFLARGGMGHRQSTWYSRWAALRRLGILIDPLARERSSVPVGAHLRAMVDRLAASSALESAGETASCGEQTCAA
jgi:hypothetical protein